MKEEEKPKYVSADMDALILQADKMIEKCELCEWKCGVDRNEGKKGFCRVGISARVSTAFPHTGEERMLIPSGTIFFSGCNFNCCFCQNHEISQNPDAGAFWSEKDIVNWIDGNIGYIKNVNFVGGEPTPNLPTILKAINELKKRKIEIPIIWNSNMYMSEEAMGILNEVVDLYLSDFKYGNSKCAKKYSNVLNYFEIVSRNHKLAYSKSKLLIRHLVLPGHVQCCSKPVLDWIRKNTPKALVNIMDEFQPAYKSKECGLERPITGEEYEEVLNYAEDLRTL